MIPVSVPYRISGLSTDSRLIVYSIVAVLGILIQVFVPQYRTAGIFMMLLPLPLLSARPWTNKPKDLGEEDWQAVTDAEVDRIAENFKNARKIRIPLWYRPGFGIPFTIILTVLSFVFDLERTIPGILCMDALILLWPALYFLKIKIWIPRQFELIMTAIQAARTVSLPAGIHCTPYLRFDRDREGLLIPEDCRLMYEIRNKPADLVGVQVQVVVNNGPNGEVPYMYAVVLTHGQGQTWKKIISMGLDRKFVVEPGGDEDYGTVVIRQKTDDGGYHTTKDDCRTLIYWVIQILEKLASH
ncbi:hypothetical protein [Gracilinema caldarium]|uniref:hypothetical protein n=1 Tax=Gracilinema caldarium TaxID=215591 RepID=UPI0026EA6000|nr:hypothetical protein [Gracilinema caldarium]